MKQQLDTDALISKFLAGEASPEEAMQLEDWKAESPENRAYFERSRIAFGWADLVVDTNEAWLGVESQLKPQAKVRRFDPKIVYSIAAALVVLLAIGSFVLFMVPGSSVETYTAQATKKSVKLNDGTSIVIAKNSSIELAPGYGKQNRLVKLKGSGYFSVKHSEQLPFVIDAGPLHIKDLGTKFDVNATKDTIFVRVDEGLVMIYDNTGLKLTLKASESAYYVIATGEMELEVETHSGTGAAKTFVFDNQRLEDVVKRMSSVYNVDIRLDNPQLKSCLITVRFDNEDLETALAVVAETMQLTLEKQGTVYLLKGQSCTH